MCVKVQPTKIKFKSLNIKFLDEFTVNRGGLGGNEGLREKVKGFSANSIGKQMTNIRDMACNFIRPDKRHYSKSKSPGKRKFISLFKHDSPALHFFIPAAYILHFSQDQNSQILSSMSSCSVCADFV